MNYQSLNVIKGNDQTFTLTFADTLGPIDISLWTITFVVKDQKTLAAILTKTVTDHSDPTAGKSKVALTNIDTNIARKTYKYTLTVKTGAGEIYTLLTGAFTVKEH